MKQHRSQSFVEVFLILLGYLLPLAALFVASSLGFRVPAWLFISVLLPSFFLLLRVLSRDAAEGERPADEAPPESGSEEGKELARRLAPLFPADVFAVQEWEVVETGAVFRGKLKVSPEEAVERVIRRLREATGARLVVSLQEDAEGKPCFFVLSKAHAALLDRATPAQRPWINVSLLGATLATTTMAGAAHQGINLLKEPSAWAVGLPYALGVMLILGIHEMGHYLTARRHGVRVSLPYFVPLPFGLGTFGAFIQMPPLLKNRRVLFDIGVAGPLAGLAVAIPALLIGLQWSTIETGEPDPQAAMQGASLKSSVLLALLARLAMGEAVSQGHALLLHPLAFAGWLGLMITALNLLPVGQLDGGHVAYSLLGRVRAARLANVALFAMIFLGIFVWPGLFYWAIIVYFLAGVRGLPPLDDVTPMTPIRWGIGLFALALLLLILSPVPHDFAKTIGLHCPYV